MVDGFCDSQCLFINPQKFRAALASSGVKEIGLRIFACIRLNWALPAYGKHAHAKAQQ